MNSIDYFLSGKESFRSNSGVKESFRYFADLFNQNMQGRIVLDLLDLKRYKNLQTKPHGSYIWFLFRSNIYNSFRLVSTLFQQLGFDRTIWKFLFYFWLYDYFITHFRYPEYNLVHSIMGRIQTDYLKFKFRKK